MVYGFTNSFADLKSVVRFRRAAVVDGWSIKATYPTEDEASASTLEKDGFKMLVLTRVKPGGKWKYEAKVSMWCPRGITVNIPIRPLYSWSEIKRTANTCPVCKNTGVETVKVAFANRACKRCEPALRKQLETPGWCD